MAKGDKKDKKHLQAKPKPSLDKTLSFGDILGNPRENLENIIERGPKTPTVQASALVTSILTDEIEAGHSGEKERSPLSPTQDETLTYRNLCSVFFGDFIRGARIYAMAKYIEEHQGRDNVPPALQQFIDHPAPDFAPFELHAVGWEAVNGLMQKLSPIVFKLQYNESKPLQARPGEDIELVRANRDQAQDLVREKEMLSIIAKFYKDYGICDASCTEEEIRAEVKKILPNFELLVSAVLNDKPESPSLLTAMDKKFHSKDLNATDQQILTKHAEIVEAWDMLLYKTGWGLAASPCDQVFDSVKNACLACEKYHTDDLSARASANQGNQFQAKQQWREAMAHHEEALKNFRSASIAMKPVCERMARMVTFSGDHHLPDAVLDKAEKAVRGMATFSRDPSLDYACKRIDSSFTSIQRRTPKELNEARKYYANATLLSSMGNTLQVECDDIVKDIHQLRNLAPGDQRKVKLSDPVYRSANYRMRTMMHRLEMVQMSAQDLYKDMAQVTGKNPLGWNPFKNPGEESAFVPPANPSKELKEYADHMQRFCVAMHKEAASRWKEMQEITQQFYGGDKFDITLDLFQRIHADINAMAEFMQKRQDYWKSQNSGVASPA